MGIERIAKRPVGRNSILSVGVDKDDLDLKWPWWIMWMLESDPGFSGVVVAICRSRVFGHAPLRRLTVHAARFVLAAVLGELQRRSASD